jgi:predicted DNA-binding protein (MmcQ/YjbR family)
MTKRELINHCLEHYDCIEDYPFDEVTAVMKLISNQKMFALISERNDSVYINLKCNPDEAIILRDQFVGITEGYHMNKKHWNSVIPDSDVPFELIQKMMDDSYNLVKPKIKKKIKK